MKRIIALVAMSISYTLAVISSKVLGFLVPRRKSRSGRILVIGTFHNPNWFFAHITPLSRCGISEIIVVGDGFTQDLPNVRIIVPNRIASALLTRSVTKFIWGFYCGVRYRPDLYMGYAIFPAAISALVLSRMFGRPSCFQLTSGKLELEGGGYHAENRLLSALGRPSRHGEKLAFWLTRQFDLIVVRGSKAEQYVRNIGFSGRIATITGSVVVPTESKHHDARDIDLAYVARLTRRKRPDRFVEVVRRVAQIRPNVRAVIIGDGPETEDLHRQIEADGLLSNISMMGIRTDVQELVGNSRVFVLTSRWEGLSIALLEAMAAGSVPVASDVGDLADVVINGETGYLVEEEDLNGFTDAILSLLENREHLDACSVMARSVAIEKSSAEKVQLMWRRVLLNYVYFQE